MLGGSSPLELLNDELVLTFNFNKHIFSAVYAFDRYKPETLNFKSGGNTYNGV